MTDHEAAAAVEAIASGCATANPAPTTRCSPARSSSCCRAAAGGRPLRNRRRPGTSLARDRVRTRTAGVSPPPGKAWTVPRERVAEAVGAGLPARPPGRTGTGTPPPLRVPERPGRVRARLRGTSATAAPQHPQLRETRLPDLRRCRVTAARAPVARHRRRAGDAAGWRSRTSPPTTAVEACGSVERFGPGALVPPCSSPTRTPGSCRTCTAATRPGPGAAPGPGSGSRARAGCQQPAAGGRGGGGPGAGGDWRWFDLEAHRWGESGWGPARHGCWNGPLAAIGTAHGRPVRPAEARQGEEDPRVGASRRHAVPAVAAD